jgi:hypothetical protein
MCGVETAVRHFSSPAMTAKNYPGPVSATGKAGYEQCGIHDWSHDWSHEWAHDWGRRR